jgi:hypothetical protein
MTEPQQIDLEQYKELLNARWQAAKLRDYYAGIVKDADEELAKLVGDGVGTFHGQTVFARPTINRFAAATFTKDHPDLAQHFMTTRVKDVLDEQALKRAQPDLYQQYLVRQTQFTFDPVEIR